MSANYFARAILVLSLLAAAANVRADEPGQADLDKAIAAKIKAENIEDLGEVIELCQSALDRGLDKDNTAFAKQLLAATLVQRAEHHLRTAAIAARGSDRHSAVHPAAADSPWPTWNAPCGTSPRRRRRISCWPA